MLRKVGQRHCEGTYVALELIPTLSILKLTLYMVNQRKERSKV